MQPLVRSRSRRAGSRLFHASSASVAFSAAVCGITPPIRDVRTREAPHLQWPLLQVTKDLIAGDILACWSCDAVSLIEIIGAEVADTPG